MSRGLLIDLATDVIKLIGSLHPVPPVDEVGLRQRFVDLVSEFHTRGVRAGYPSDLMDAARFALVVLIDERVTGLDAALATTWKHQPLQQQLFGRTDGDVAFFERLAALRPPASPDHADVVEVFHLCLCFGVRGRYRDASEEPTRRALIAAVAGEILACRGAPAHGGLSPDWQPAPGRPRQADAWRWCGVPIWWVPLAGGVALLVWWLAGDSWTAAAIAALGEGSL